MLQLLMCLSPLRSATASKARVTCKCARMLPTRSSPCCGRLLIKGTVVTTTCLCALTDFFCHGAYRAFLQSAWRRAALNQPHSAPVDSFQFVGPCFYAAATCCHFAELAVICHAEGVPLLVDEAHGGHLGAMAADLARAAAAPSGCTDASRPAGTRSPAQPSVLEGGAAPADECSAHSKAAASLVEHLTTLAPQDVPVAALEAGADLVMHSTHKVLTAMTQAAMLHLRDASRVDPGRVSKALQVGLVAGQRCMPADKPSLQLTVS